MAIENRPRPMRTLAAPAAVLLSLLVGHPVTAEEAAVTVVTTSRAEAGGSEELGLSDAVLSRLSTLRIGDTLRVDDWPVAPQERLAVTLRRFDVYDAGSRMLVVGRGGELLEVPRAPQIFLAGETTDRRQVLVILDPASPHALTAETASDETRQELRPTRPGRWRLGAATSDDRGLTFECGAQELEARLGAWRAVRESLQSTSAEALASRHQAVIAVETDNEFMQLKFGNSAAAAVSYIANLFARMNIIYERDVNVRLLQGLTFLRPSTQPDPYTGGTGGADGTKLAEFSAYWDVNYPRLLYPRAAAAMLSGKQASANSTSGIAWLDALCSEAIGYSFTQVYKFAQDTSQNDSRIVGHEVGHNFGAPHTHCHSTPIDTCWKAETGCYSGQTTSCPATMTYNGVSARGTIMSYCHLLGGCSVADVFHPRSLSEEIDPHVQSKVGVCVFPVSNMENLFFYTLTPCRLVDTRGNAPIQGGALAAGEERVWVLAGAGNCGLPPAAGGLTRAASLNITVTGAGAAGDLSFTAGDLAPPKATAISFSAGATRANNAVLPLSITPTQGAVRVKNNSASTVHVIVDVNGYFRP